MAHVVLVAGMVSNSIPPRPIAAPADNAIKHTISCLLLHDLREGTVLRRNVLGFGGVWADVSIKRSRANCSIIGLFCPFMEEKDNQGGRKSLHYGTPLHLLQSIPSPGRISPLG
jgi:hypothetical protein